MKNDRIENLLWLIKYHPELPIIPIVSGEICGDDSGYWMGVWGVAAIDEYLTSENGETFFRSDDDLFYTLERYFSRSEFEALPQDETECQKIYENLPWKKAIIVYIDPR